MRKVVVSTSGQQGWGALTFAYDPEIVQVLRALRRRRWDPDGRRWLVAVEQMDLLRSELDKRRIRLVAGNVPAARKAGASRPAGTPPETTVGLLQQTEDELRLKGYSPKTREAYLKLIRRFIAHVGEGGATVENARTYQLGAVTGDARNSERPSPSAITDSSLPHCASSAHMFLHADLPKDTLPAPRRGRSLPNVLSLQDVARILDAPRNPSHRLMLQLLYSTGLRVSELVRLRMGDLDRERRLVRVRQGKGHRDRFTLYSDRVANAVDSYAAQYLNEAARNSEQNPLLFPGPRPGHAISTRTVQHVVTRAA